MKRTTTTDSQLLSGAQLFHLAQGPILESIPLQEILLLCRSDKRFNEECQKSMTGISARVAMEQPPLPLSILRALATKADTDERLRSACIKRLQWRKTISAGTDHCLAILDDGTIVGWGKDHQGQISGAAQALPRGRRYVSVGTFIFRADERKLRFPHVRLLVYMRIANQS